MTRRTFFRSLGASLSPVCPTLSFAAGLAADKPGVPVIDTHIHLFDVSRPQGVPWPPRDSGIYRSALPPRYRQLAVPHGIVGAIAIECSPWLADNQWLLDVAGQDPLLVGVIGNLEPGTPGFAKHLERFQANPLFRGIRYGNLWGRDLSKEVLKPAFIEDLKTLAAAGLALDTANPNPALLHAVVQLTDLVPKLTVILNHLPALQAPDDLAARRTCELDLRQLSARPQVAAKLSGIVRTVKGRVPLAVDYYRDRLDHIWETFGPDRLLYGSDWPNSEQWASYSAVFQLAESFVAAKDSASIEKFYWRNALRVYRWKKREGSVAPQ